MLIKEPAPLFLLEQQALSLPLDRGKSMCMTFSVVFPVKLRIWQRHLGNKMRRNARSKGIASSVPELDDSTLAEKATAAAPRKRRAAA